MKRLKHGFLIVAAAFCTGLLLAGCGGSSDSAAAPGAAPPGQTGPNADAVKRADPANIQNDPRNAPPRPAN